MANRFVSPNQQFFGPNGQFLSGGLLTFFVSGTTTLAITYSDEGLTTPNPNPVVLDSNGYANSVFLDPSVTYKVVLSEPNGSQIWSFDPVGDDSNGTTPLGSTASVSADESFAASYEWQTNDVNRFVLSKDNEAETGSNAGSNLIMSAFSDAGVLVTNCFSITRATGIFDFSSGVPTVQGGSFASAIAASLASLGITVATGTVVGMAMPFSVNGYLLCDGSTFTQAQFPNLFNYLVQTVNCTISIASPSVFTTSSPHGLVNNTPLTLNTTGSLPTGFSEGTTYFTQVASATTFTLAASPNGSAIAGTGSQSGQQSYNVAPWGVPASGSFNVPNLLGLFPRFFDPSGTIDIDRGFAVLEQSQLQTHTHLVGFDQNETAGGSGPTLTNFIGSTGQFQSGPPNSGNSGSETRPINQTLFPFIKT
jgi:hypothetical protein